MKTFAFCSLAVLVCAGTVAQAQEYYRGRMDTVPREFRNPRFIYEDWRERGLPPPARGQAWIHVCDSYILAYMRTGHIAQVHRVGQSRVDQKPGFRLSDSFNCMQGGRYGYRSRYLPYD